MCDLIVFKGCFFYSSHSSRFVSPFKSHSCRFIIKTCIIILAVVIQVFSLARPLETKIRKEGRRMAKNSKQTSKAVASKASKILRDRRYGTNAKSVAGSALAQTKPGRK